MAQFYTDHADQTVDTTPTGWTNRYTTPGSFLVKEAAGRKYLALLRGAANSTLYAASWDAAGSATDVEVFTLWSPGASGAFVSLACAFMRGSGAAGTESNYFFAAQETSSNIRQGRIMRTVSGTLASPGGSTFAFEWEPDTIFAQITRVAGTSIKMKIWQPADVDNPAADVPAAWSVEFNDSNVSGAGWVGWGNYTSSPSNADRLYAIGVGTGGDAAPMSGTTALATPSGFTFTAGSGVRTLSGSWSPVSGAATYDWEVQEDVASVWTAFASGNTASTSFALSSADGVDWDTTYRARVRAQPSA